MGGPDKDRGARRRNRLTATDLLTLLAVVLSAAVLVPRTLDNWGGAEAWMSIGVVLTIAALVVSVRGTSGRIPTGPWVVLGFLVLQLLFWTAGSVYGTR